MILFIPAVLSFLTVALLDKYESLRYAYNVVPVFVAFSVFLACRAVESPGITRKAFLLPLACLLCNIAVLFIFPPKYLYTEYRAINEMADRYGGLPCVYYSEEKYRPQSALSSDLGQLMRFDDFLFIDTLDKNVIDGYLKSHGSDMCIFYAASFYKPKDFSGLAEDFREAAGYSECMPLYEADFSYTYLLK